MRRFLALALMGWATWTALGSRAQAITYDFTTIDVPGSYYTTVYGINEAGQVVGSFNYGSNAPDHGFIFSGGSFSTIDVPGALGTQVLGINDAGQIVGAYYDNSAGPGTGFLDTGGSFTTIDVPGSYYTTVYGINDAGQLAGSFNYGSDAPDHGFTYSGGSFSTIDVPGALGTQVLGINDAGQIVGAYYDNSAGPGTGFVTKAVPEPSTLPLFATGLGVMGWFGWRKKRKGLAMKSKLLGVAALALLGVVFPADADPYTFNILNIPGAIGSQATGINNAGEIVGSFFTNSSDAAKASSIAVAFTLPSTFRGLRARIPSASTTQARLSGLLPMAKITATASSPHRFPPSPPRPPSLLSPVALA